MHRTIYGGDYQIRLIGSHWFARQFLLCNKLHQLNSRSWRCICIYTQLIRDPGSWSKIKSFREIERRIGQYESLPTDWTTVVLRGFTYQGCARQSIFQRGEGENPRGGAWDEAKKRANELIKKIPDTIPPQKYLWFHGDRMNIERSASGRLSCAIS